MLKKVKKLINNFITVRDPEKGLPKNYKSCQDCDGMGYIDLFTQCDTCGGKGMIKKTYQEYVDSLPPR